MDCAGGHLHVPCRTWIWNLSAPAGQSHTLWTQAVPVPLISKEWTWVSNWLPETKAVEAAWTAWNMGSLTTALLLPHPVVWQEELLQVGKVWRAPRKQKVSG